LKALKAEADTTATLRAENQLLKKQLASLRTARRPRERRGRAPAVGRAQAQIAALESDKEILRLEKIGLENRVRQLSVPAVAAAVTAPKLTAEDANRIRKLQQEKNDLRKQLDAATRDLNGARAKWPRPRGGNGESSGHAKGAA